MHLYSSKTNALMLSFFWRVMDAFLFFFLQFLINLFIFFASWEVYMLVLFSVFWILLYYLFIIIFSLSSAPQIKSRCRKIILSRRKVKEVPSQSLLVKFEKKWKKGEWPGTQKECTKYFQSIMKKWGPREALWKYWKDPNQTQTTNQKSHKIKENKTNPK